MQAEKFDIPALFPEIVREVRQKGECVIDTGTTLYILKPEAAKKIRELTKLLDSIDYSALLPSHTDACFECSKERSKLVASAISNLEQGKTAEARMVLKSMPKMNFGECQKCAEEANKQALPILSYDFSLTTSDFSLKPHLSMSTKLNIKYVDVVKEYKTRLNQVRILEALSGEYYYDPVLPIEVLSAKERGLVSLTQDVMKSRLTAETSKILDYFYKTYGVDKSKLQNILDTYINKFGDLQYLIEDKNLTDIYVSSQGVVQVSSYDYGDMECTLRFTRKGLSRLAEQFSMISKKPFDMSRPLASFFWEEQNCRISATGYSANYSGSPDFAVRLWPESPWHILDIVHRGSANFFIASLLTVAALLGGAIIFGGDRGGGKSTLLQTSLFMIPRHSRKVALLTSREIHKWFYDSDFRITELRVHAGNEVTGEGVPINDAAKQLLIHGESGYLIFNEIKYEEEARPFLTLSAVAGLSSLLTTMHADTPEGIVHRLLIDFQLPLVALRNIDWIVMTQVVRSGASREKRRVITKIVEIEDFVRDPISERKLKTLTEYDPLEDVWKTGEGDLRAVVDSSKFLISRARAMKMSRGDLAATVEALERVYRTLYGEYPIDPGKFSETMECFFRAWLPGRGAERMYNDWLRCANAGRCITKMQYL